MKKLSVFLMSIVILFSSCTNLINHNEIVTITKRETKDDKMCWFETNKYENDMFGNNMWFSDSCHKYNIGDTIQISRK